MKADKNQAIDTNYYILFFVLIIIFAITIIMSFLGEPWTQYDNWRQTILSLLGATQATAIVFIIWEVAAKRSFAAEVLKLAGISTNISIAGVEHFVVISHGNTWRESNRETLKLFCEKSKLRIFLPNFLDEDIMDTLDRRFNYEKGKTALKIIESICEFKKIGAEIYLYNGSFQSSYYVTDKCSIMSVFNHQVEKGTVPAIKVSNSGTLHKYINDEINAILNNSEVYNEEGKVNEE